MTIPNYSPFSNSSEFDYWTCENCAKCAKALNEAAGQHSHCALEDALYSAAISDGTLRLAGENSTAQAAALADRLAWDGINRFPRRCAEFARKEGSNDE